MTASSPAFLMVHGWAMDPSLWDPIRDRLAAPSLTLDLGYFGPALLTARPPGTFVAVGHSFGALWLLRHWPEDCVGLAAINGFGRFAAGPDFPEGAPRRPLDRMIDRFGQDPQGVTADFRARCGAPGRPLDDLNAARAGEDLLALRDWDERPVCARGRPILVLAGGQDPIAPAALVTASFAACPQARVSILEGEGHLLPLTAAGACAAALQAFGAEVLP